MRSDDVEGLRRRVEQLINQGLSPCDVSRTLACSRTTVYKVLRAMHDPSGSLVDGRRANPGRPVLFAQELWDLILAERKAHPQLGPVMLYHSLCRRAQELGISESDVPAPSTIALAIRKAGLAHKPVGPRDKRTYPDDRPQRPGTITLDTWGPWRVRATRVYLITAQDRYTRLSIAFPIMGHPNSAYAEVLAATAASWARALNCALAHLLPEPTASMVYCDNGIGMAPAHGVLPHGARHVLAAGAALTYIPPGEPWRNGRLERFHWTMEREFWRIEMPRRQEDAINGLRDYLNYYNTQRPHSALGYKSPAEVAPWYKPLQGEWWAQDAPRYEQPVAGIVNAVRLVDNAGVIELWEGERLRVSPVLGGQYVRVEFRVTGSHSAGRVVYNRKRGEDIVVATFSHWLDAHRKRGQPLVDEAVNVDFDEKRVAANQLLDESQNDARLERILKRGRVRREPEGQPDAQSG